MAKSWKYLSIFVALALVLSLAMMALPVATPVLASPGTDYYVATTGDDSRTATQAQNPATPWKTITHAVATVPAGASSTDPNVIHVAAGLYDVTNNVETFHIDFDNNNVSLIGAGAATTTIDGESAATILDIDANGITIQGFTINNATNGIKADVGGFTVKDNIFSSVGYGVYFYINETELTADYTIDDILIEDNEFNISTTGVCTNIALEYAAAQTGKNVTIGGMDIMDNTFNMATTTGIDIDIKVEDLNGGTVSMGEVDISDGNEFNGGTCGIDFYGYFYDFTDTTVTVGDITVNDNTFTEQTDVAVYIQYYQVSEWYGESAATFGDLEINRNDITSTYTSCNGIYVDNYAYWYELHGAVSVDAGHIHIQDNDPVEVGCYGIYVNYYRTKTLYDSASVTLGELSIQGNQVVSGSRGIYIDYDNFGYNMYNSSQVTTGEVHIGGTGVNEGNTIDAGIEAIYIHFEYVACYMNEGTTPCEASLLMGDIYIQENSISGQSDGVYIEHYYEAVGYYMYDDAYAELPDYVITGNTFNVTGNGIYYDTLENPSYIYDNSTIDFGGFFIDDNTFNDETAGMDHGIYLDNEEFCYSNYDTSTTILGAVTITNNRFYDLGDDAICIYFVDLGYKLEDNSMLEVGDTVIADNVIDGANYGIDIYYDVEACADNIELGILDIARNNISNVTNDGIYLYGDFACAGPAQMHSPTEGSTWSIITVEDYPSLVTTISENIITDCSDNGICLGDYHDVSITDNLIWHNNDGIYLDGCDNIQIQNNDILTNPGPTSGVHLDSECGPDTVINYNNIVANSSGDWGIYNASTNVIDAENNWWGDPSGPDDDDGIINGSGDKISNYVDADPWLTQQSHATIYEQTTTATGSGTASVQTDGGAVTDLEAVDEGTLPNAGKPDLTFPHGFFSFNIIGLTPGQTVTVTITLPANVPIGTEYWKYHASEGGWIEIPMGSDNGDNIITITLVDGELGDDDLTADGVITDQGAPGFVPHPVGVGGEAYPVNKLAILAPWLVLAVLLIGVITWFTLRRRKAYR